MTVQPRFITFEGIDNCGKTTQIDTLARYLVMHDIPFRVEREPGSTALGGLLRRVLKDPRSVYAMANLAFKDNPDFHALPFDQERTPKAELFLFLAARAEYLDHVVHPTLLDKRESLISDRFIDSTEAYQGGGHFDNHPMALQLIQTAHEFLLHGFYPDITFLLDIPYEEMRKRGGSAQQDYFERKGKDFFGRVRNTYLRIARDTSGDMGDKIVLIDGMKPREDIFTREIVPHINKLYDIK